MIINALICSWVKLIKTLLFQVFYDQSNAELEGFFKEEPEYYHQEHGTIDEYTLKEIGISSPEEVSLIFFLPAKSSYKYWF